MSYCVFDIETIPDPEIVLPEDLVAMQKAAAAEEAALQATAAESMGADGVPAGAEPKKAAKKKSSKKAKAADDGDDETKEPKTAQRPAFAQIPVCIGYYCFDSAFRPGVYGVATLEQYGGERPLLELFSQFIQNQQAPTLVTWGGRGFDMPVIELRSFRHLVPQAWHKGRYRVRYDEDHHLDLLDVMTNFGAVNKKGFKLGNVASAIGLPGKDGIDGSKVAEVYAQGRKDEIAHYCMTDVIQTSIIMLRYQVMRGNLTADAYNNVVDTMFARLLEHGDTYKRFLSQVDMGRVRLAPPAPLVEVASPAPAPAMEAPAGSNGVTSHT